MLIENGAESESQQYGNLKTPLHAACETGNAEIVKLLLNSGVSVDAETASSRFFDLDKTPLHYACRRGFLHIVQLLVNKNANIFSLSHDNLSSIQIAEKQGHSNISSFLLSVINCTLFLLLFNFFNIFNIFIIFIILIIFIIFIILIIFIIFIFNIFIIFLLYFCYHFLFTFYYKLR